MGAQRIEINYCVCVCRDVYRTSGIEAMCNVLDDLQIEYGVTRSDIRSEMLHMGDDMFLSTDDKVYLMTRQFNDIS